MAYRLIGQDCSVSTYLAGIANGTAPTFSTLVDRKSLAREIGVEEGIEDTGVSGLADGLTKKRVRRSNAQVNLELYIGSAGPLFADKVGYAIKIHYAELASNAGEDFVGFISKVQRRSPDGEATEQITVDIALEGYTYTGIYA